MMRFGRAAVALVWLYHGLWCKLLRGCANQAAIVDALPGLHGPAASWALAGVGAAETALALWVLAGRAPRLAALVQTVLLVAMNAGGLLWGRAHIAEPGAMLVQNTAFLALVWLVARDDSRDVATASTPWSRGRLSGRAGSRPVLLFGQMHEDWRLEAEIWPAGSRVLCIASAGCTALALARGGREVAAVDVNAAQVDYVRERVAGGPIRAGHVDAGLAVIRRLAPAVGWTDLRAFLDMDDPDDQVRHFDRKMDTRRLRALGRLFLHPLTLGLVYEAAFVRAVPPRFADELRRRLRRGLGRHANRTNPYAWRLFAGETPPADIPEPPVPAGTLTLACSDAAGYLEGVPAGSFHGFSLSNILDGATPAYRTRLAAAVRRAAARGATVVVRSFAPAKGAEEEEWAARDRALLWGGVRVVTAEAL